MINRIKVLVFIAVSLYIGFFAAKKVNGFLGISFKAKDIPKTPSFDEIRMQKADLQSDSQLNLRIIDLGGVGILPDTINWGKGYSHNVNRFEDVMMIEPPFIDDKNFERVENEFHTYIDRMQRFNFNGLVFQGFLEFTLFDKVGSGTEIYPEGSTYRQRHIALRQAFDRLFKYAHEKGLKVYLYTDMVALTPMLENYFMKKFGKIDVSNKEFWAIYKLGLEELFENLNIDGLVIRIGEAGAIYNKPGWDYRSELYVRDAASVNLMLSSLLETVEKFDKTLVFRTWSVGIGKIGDMHTNPETYLKVLDKIKSPNLVVSTKYCKGDFDSYLPLNPTLSIGSHRRITEMQARREFEAFNSIPNYIAPLYQIALKQFRQKNPKF
jgi:hypothetical protein